MNIDSKGFQGQKTIFRRYIRITMTIVIVGFILLGVITMTFFAQYWSNEKKSVLDRETRAVVKLAEGTALYYGNDRDNFPSDVVENVIATYAKSNNINIILTDSSGTVIHSAYAGERYEEPVKEISQELINAILASEGSYSENGRLYGAYKNKFFSVAMPFYNIKGGTGELIGFAISSVSSSPLSGFLTEALEIFLVASVLVLIVCFFVVGFFSYSLVLPLRQMSEAVKDFGGGDFSKRVPVTSEDELGQLATAINEMAKSLSNSEGMRRSFVANVSHELKTPMTTIAGFVDGILDGTIQEKDRDKYLRIVSEEVKRLSRLVKSMLDLSRIDSGEMKISPIQFDITNIIFVTVLTFEKAIDDKQIEIRGLEDVQHEKVYGDKDLIHQVTYNLIENAVKFTNPGGYILFEVTDSIDRTVVSIQNSGNGIEPEELPMIFDRFYKTDKSRSKDKNGMGLGLYIVKTIIQLHGGEISVSSKVNEYCRFEFFLPKRSLEVKEKMDNTGRIHEVKPSDVVEIDVFDADISAAEEASKEKGNKK